MTQVCLQVVQAHVGALFVVEHACRLLVAQTLVVALQVLKDLLELLRRVTREENRCLAVQVRNASVLPNDLFYLHVREHMAFDGPPLDCARLLGH